MFPGFASYTGFYSGGEDYYTHVSSGAYDFRNDPEPNCRKGCSQVDSGAQGDYSGLVFSSAAVDVVNKHDTSKPLFLYLAYQNVHAPAEVPQSYMDRYNTTIKDLKRRKFAGMLTVVDEGLGNVTAAMAEKGMLDNTIIIFTSDNGGPSAYARDLIGRPQRPMH